MAQRDRVLALLRGHEARRIRFTVPSASVPVTINHVTFNTVANAIVAGKIGVSPFAVSARGALAEYHQPAGPTAPSSGQLMVPPIRSHARRRDRLHGNGPGGVRPPGRRGCRPGGRAAGRQAGVHPRRQDTQPRHRCGPADRRSARIALRRRARRHAGAQPARRRGRLRQQGARCRLRPAGQCRRRVDDRRRQGSHHLPGTRHSRAGRAGTLPYRGRRDHGQAALPAVSRAAGAPDLRADHAERRRVQRACRRHRAKAAAEAGLYPSRHHPARGGLRSRHHRAHAGMAVALDRHPRGRSCRRDLLLDRRQRLHRQHRAAGAAPARPRAAGGEARSEPTSRRGSTARSAPGSR